jgi:hypothetical protein
VGLDTSPELKRLLKDQDDVNIAEQVLAFFVVQFEPRTRSVAHDDKYIASLELTYAIHV